MRIGIQPEGGNLAAGVEETESSKRGLDASSEHFVRSSEDNEGLLAVSVVPVESASGVAFAPIGVDGCVCVTH